MSFNTVPFYTPVQRGERLLDMRLYRPVMEPEGQTKLREFRANVATILMEAGFDEEEVTLQECDRYEVSIVSKGSINLAVDLSNSDLFKKSSAKIIAELLMERMPETVVQELSVIADRIKPYSPEPGETANTAKYLTVSSHTADDSMDKYVSVERHVGYDVLRNMSEVRKFAGKLGKMRTPTFRFAAFHNPEHFPDEDTVREIAGLLPMDLVLGKVASGGFEQQPKSHKPHRYRF